MKKHILSIFVILSLSIYSLISFSSDNHANEGHEEEDHKTEAHEEHSDHDEHKKEEHGHDEHGDEHAHEDKEAHAKKDEHGHAEGEEEESSSVGPDKGITAKSEDGFKLSPEAVKTMEIQMQEIKSTSLSIDKKTLVLVKDEKSVFRVRDGWIKRVPVQILSRSSGIYTVSSTSLKEGDQIVIHGTGYLRIAEVFANEGASHGHSH